jgi:uncharacterized protein (TIGR03546 family)
MLALLKLLQSLIKTLHSDGTPAQIALGFALGAALGLTPIVNLHNVVVLALLALLNVSFAAGLLGWAIFVPVGFLLDPVFDRLGLLLLESPALRPLFTTLDNTPVFALANLNNSVVLGSLLVWLLLIAPVYLLARFGVVRYRATIGERVRRTRMYSAISASRAYNVYRWFRP